MKRFKKWITKNGFEVIQVLNLRSNAYLILKDNVAILIDTGRKSAFQTLTKNIRHLDLKFEQISFLILTHTHYDHCQSAKYFKDISGCKIISSNNAADSVKNGYTVLPNGSIPITKLISKLGQLIGKKKFRYEPFIPDILVNSEFKFNVGDSQIIILGTPGHSKDSVSIIIDDEIAVVGDVMFGVFKNSIFPPYSDDLIKMIESWGILLDTHCQIFLPGHGNEINRNLLKKEYEKYAVKYLKR